MMNEADVKTATDEDLKLKGWNFQSKNLKSKTVWQEGDTKTSEQKKLLNGGRPDYILYQSNQLINIPIAIIEVKSSRKSLDFALNTQARSYAKSLNAPIIIAYNSIDMLTEYIPTGKPLIINGKPVKKFLSENELLKFIKKNSNEITKSVEEESV